MKEQINEEEAYLIGQKDALTHSLETIKIQEQKIKRDIESIDKEINNRRCCKK